MYQWAKDGKRPSEIRKLQIKHYLKYKAMAKGWARKQRIAGQSGRTKKSRQNAIRGMRSMQSTKSQRRTTSKP